MVTLRINGANRSFPGPLTVSALLEELEIKAVAVAIEVNRTIIPRSTHQTHELEDGDHVEIVTFVGGG